MVTKAHYYIFRYLVCCYQRIDLLLIQQSNSNSRSRLTLNIKLLNALDILQHLAFPEPFNGCCIFLDLCLTGILVICLRLIKKLHAVHQRQSKKSSLWRSIQQDKGFPCLWRPVLTCTCVWPGHNMHHQNTGPVPHTWHFPLLNFLKEWKWVFRRVKS